MGDMTSRELFDQAIEVVLGHEGDTYSNHPNDRGGATKFGISQRYNPDVNVRELTRAQAIEIYWERYWQGRGYERLPDPVAIKVFDLAVNLGERTAVRCLQRALRACGVPVKIDGLLGPQTCGAARSAEVGTLVAALRSEAAGEYRLRVARDGGQAVFQNGWLNRAYA
jgi:lysozyme family protein